jgi:hypothetical protein
MGFSFSFLDLLTRALHKEALPVLDPRSSRMIFLTIFFSKPLPLYFLTLVRLAHARLPRLVD